MITTLEGIDHKDVRTLKRGDVFRTNRDGTLTWSDWFIAIDRPRFKVYDVPTRKKRWGLLSRRIVWRPISQDNLDLIDELLLDVREDEH